MASSISPHDENASSSIVTLLQELGRSQEAIATINENVKRNSNNPTFLTQLGDVYMNQDNLDKAIELFEQALVIDPNFASALRNVGACYGLKASKIQQEQNELQKAGTIKSVDINTYLMQLTKAAEYLTRALSTNEFKNDQDILGDLCGIYLVIPNEKANYDKYLKQLEDLEPTIPPARLEAYYLRLYRIYSATGNPKMNDIEKKLN
jgi:tetratricopeptide (TPR) repeat protein